jgi:hypothetical protein
MVRSGVVERNPARDSESVRLHVPQDIGKVKSATVLSVTVKMEGLNTQLTSGA